MPYKTLECEHCGSEFKGHHNTKYCTEECKRLERTEKYICFECGKVFRRAPSRNSSGKNYCSRGCQQRARNRKVAKTCKQCGESFEVSPCRSDAKYCSTECSGKARRGENKQQYSCDACGDTFHRSPRDANRCTGTYCSKECSARGKSKERVSKECGHCGQSFTAYPSRSDERKYCSRTCSARERGGGSIYKECEVCGEEFRVNASTNAKPNHGKYCSRKCKGKAFSGPNHPMWQGGYDQYYGENWSRMRSLARERDCFKCQKCGLDEHDHETELHVHHIVAFREFESPEEANMLSNLVTVCKSCHEAIEGDVEAGRALL